MKNKIDIVIPWVDGNDIEWLKEKNKYTQKKDEKLNNNSRFRDWDNLQYIFRGIEKFMPWVNNVFFITWGHLPKWLNVDNPKLKIINHKDYIPSEYLPTFNSHTIELNIHRIKGLSEKFIYFNDDTFVIDYMSENMFFKNGLPCDCGILNPIIPFGYDNFSNVSVNNLTVINEEFNKRLTIKKAMFKWYNVRYHLPNSFLKSTFCEVWQKYDKILDKTCLCHLRDNFTNVNQWLMRYWQLCKNEFYPRNPNFGKFYEITDNNDRIIDDIKKQRFKMVCLNDGINIKDFDKSKHEINEALSFILPDKCSFEKSDTI